jgi:hypothetical protein
MGAQMKPALECSIVNGLSNEKCELSQGHVGNHRRSGAVWATTTDSAAYSARMLNNHPTEHDSRECQCRLCVEAEAALLTFAALRTEKLEEHLRIFDDLLGNEELATVVSEREDAKFCAELLFPLYKWAKDLNARMPKPDTIEALKADEGYGFRHYEINFTDKEIIEFRKLLTTVSDIEIDPQNWRKDKCTV